LAPDFDFSALKKLGLNSLYQLHRLINNPKLVEKSLELEKNPKLNLKEVKLLVNEAKQEQVDLNELTESQLKAKESLRLLDRFKEPITLPTELGSEKQFRINQELREIVQKATQNLTDLNEMLSKLILQIEGEAEKSALSNVLKAVEQVSTLLQKLQLVADASSQQNASAETNTASSPSIGNET